MKRLSGSFCFYYLNFGVDSIDVAHALVMRKTLEWNILKGNIIGRNFRPSLSRDIKVFFVRDKRDIMLDKRLTKKLVVTLWGRLNVTFYDNSFC